MPGNHPRFWRLGRFGDIVIVPAGEVERGDDVLPVDFAVFLVECEKKHALRDVVDVLRLPPGPSAKQRVARALEEGLVVAVRQSAGASGPAAATTAGAATAPSAPTSLDAPADVSFLVRFVDELGQGISGVKVKISDGQPRPNQTTDGSGKARLDESPYGSATATLVDLNAVRAALKPRWDTVRSGTILDASSGATICDLDDASVSFDLLPNKLTTVSIQPKVVRARLIGPYFDTNMCFLLEPARDALQSVVGIQSDVGTKQILVVGHTDTTGTSSYNDQLSLDRATAVKDFLSQNVEGWYAWYGADKPAEKQWGAEEDEGMIAALADAGSRDPSESPVRWYQRTRGLTVDGIAGTQTRHALIAEYMLLSPALPSDATITVHGCGQAFPQDETPPGTPDADNRRVEIYFFDTVLGVQPPPAADLSAAGATDYPEWVRRSKETQDFLEDARAVKIRIFDCDDSPLANAPYQLEAGDLTRTGTTDANGLLYEEQIAQGAPCTLRWGLPPPPGTPQPATPTYSYERELFLDYASQAKDDAAQQRLHNLGYSGDDLASCVTAFQQDAGLPQADWFDQATWDKLLSVHDFTP